MSLKKRELENLLMLCGSVEVQETDSFSGKKTRNWLIWVGEQQKLML